MKTPPLKVYYDTKGNVTAKKYVYTINIEVEEIITDCENCPFEITMIEQETDYTFNRDGEEELEFYNVDRNICVLPSCMLRRKKDE